MLDSKIGFICFICVNVRNIVWQCLKGEIEGVLRLALNSRRKMRQYSLPKYMHFVLYALKQYSQRAEVIIST